LIVINDFAHADRIAAAAGAVFNTRYDQCISRVDEDGELLGGVIYQNYTGNSVFLHMAGFAKNWCQRDMLWAIFQYPFEQLGCVKVFGQTPQSNRRSLDIQIRLGFKVEMLIEDVYKDEGVFLTSMYRDECRWLKRPPKPQ
jgi:RimJ/RimL family protein N-acetyltransferase